MITNDERIAANVALPNNPAAVTFALRQKGHSPFGERGELTCFITSMR